MNNLKFNKYRLRDLRAKANITTQTLGDAIHISRQAITKWENGQSEPCGKNVASLASFFNVSYDYFFKSSINDLIDTNTTSMEDVKRLEFSNIIRKAISILPIKDLETLANVASSLLKANN